MNPHNPSPIVLASGRGTKPAQSEAPGRVAASAPADIRISTLVGDRLCITCGYNLVGQPIFREPHYSMLIVRCPECATVASVQEYPLLGRWANRWGTLLAALWLIVVIALWAGSSAAVFGFSLGVAEMASERYGRMLYDQFNQWQMQQAPSAASGSLSGSRARGQVMIVNNSFTNFAAWWQQQDQATLLQNAGGLIGGVDAFVWYCWGWEAFVALLLGVMWATVLIAQERRGLLVWALLILVGAAGLSLIPITDWLSAKPGWTYQASRREIGPRMMGVSLAWGGLWLMAGTMIGRPVMRGLVRLMLPPRLRSSLAMLWLSDGLEPPRQTRKH